MMLGKVQAVDDGADVPEPSCKTPGASASTIKIPSFLNSLPRWILSTRCEFQGFLRSILMNPGKKDAPTSSASVWPLPLPYPEVFRRGGSLLVDGHWKRLVCLQVALMDWLMLGSPSAAPISLGLGLRLNARQWSVVRMLEHLVKDGNTPELVEASDMGRAASKVEDFQDCVGALARAASTLQACGGDYFGDQLSKMSVDVDDDLDCGKVVGRLQHSAPVAAKPLIAQRLQFPEAPRFDPHPFFDESTALRYDSPLSDGFTPDEIDAIPPQVRVLASRGERVKIYQKMAASSMIELVDPSRFYRDFRSGLFGVVKDGLRDRMVLDGRPANLLDRGQSKWVKAMANPAVLAQLFIRPERVLLTSGEDLKDFFYQFSVNKERTARNTLADELSAHEVEMIFGKRPTSSGPFYIGLSSLAMGDLCACEFAQCSHIGLCLQNQVCKVGELLTLKGSVPRGLLQVGLVIDDLVIFEQVLRGQEHMVGLSEDRISKVRDAYLRSHLPFNPKKAFMKMSCSRFWGIELDGDKGLLRCSSLRLWPACVITLRICSLGLASVGLLEAIAGTWVALLGVRRKLFSLMHYVFQPLGIADQKLILRLSPELISELVSFVIMGSLSVVNLRADYANFVCATDASCEWTAAVRADIPGGVCEELGRHCLRKGAWSRLLPAGAAWQRSHGVLLPTDELPDHEFSVHPFWEVLARCPTYSTRWRKQVRRDTHINLLEMRAYLLEERNVCLSHRSLRVPFGIDSQVCLGGVVKGRAASLALTRMMRCSIPYCIGSDVYPMYMYYPSDFNRSDGPTRNSEPKPPDLPFPTWWNQLAAGCTDGFDAWLRSNAGSRAEANDDLPFQDIAGDQDLDLKPNARVRQRRIRPTSSSDSAAMPAPVSTVTSTPSSLSEASLKILRKFSKKQVLFAEGVEGFLSPGALDLYSGRMGVARTMITLGCPWVVTFDWERDAAENLLDSALQDDIKFLITDGAILSFGAAPICSSFSVAVTPPVRSSQYPRGIPGLRPTMRLKVQQGNQHNDFVFDCVALCIIYKVTYWVENPDCSWWWRQRRWKRYRPSDGSHVFRCTFCRFGAAWRKGTRVATDTRLAGLRMMCTCTKPHVALRGMHPLKTVPWTLLAQPYPRGFARLLAVAACVKAGWTGGERLNVSGCSKCTSLRAGEADHPGPSRRRVPLHRDTLENLPLQRPQTLALEARLLKEFLRWCSASFSSGSAIDVFDKVPMFLANALRAYGDLMFQNGLALSNLRHLLIASQRWKPAVRPYMQIAWEIVERWEAQTPVSHRTPVPEVVVKSLCALAWCFGWYAWCGATLISFYGAGRVGEVLRTARSDLILPHDNLEPPGSPCFLQLRTFKSRNRQPSKIQHMKIADPYVSKLLCRIFGGLHLDEPLFANTPYQYRKRWDFLVQALGIPKSIALTPGGLRGGAAVYHYKAGRGIADVMWMMRVRAQSTLESYIQEVSALNTVARLPPATRITLQKVASLFPFLLVAHGIPGPYGNGKLG